MSNRRQSFSNVTYTVALLLFASAMMSCNGCQPYVPKTQHVQRLDNGVETTVTVIPTGAPNSNYVAAFMGETGGASWAVSADAGSTWTVHHDSDPGFAWGGIAEQQGFFNYGADPTLVPTGNPNQVAFVTAAGGKAVAIALSQDGGVHFGNVHLVSPSGLDPQPVSTFNPKTKQIWLAWTQRSGPNLTPHLMVSALHYDVAGALTFDTSAPIEVLNVPGLDIIKSDPPDQFDDFDVTIAAGDYAGQSHVAIAYADRYDTNLDGSGPCGPLDVHYYIADSVDNGQSWQSMQIVHDPAWPQCVTDVPTYNRLRPAIAFARSTGLSYYVALTQSSPTGSLVHLYRVDWPFRFGSVHDFAETPPPPGSHHDQFFPAVAVGNSTADLNDPTGTSMNVMVTWHDTQLDTTGGNSQQVVYGSVIGFGSWTGVLSPKSGAPAENVPWTLRPGFWGDYDSVAVDNNTHAFVPIWTDGRNNHTEAWASILNPIHP